MRTTVSFIGVGVVLIIGVAVIIPIVTELTKQFDGTIQSNGSGDDNPNISARISSHLLDKTRDTIISLMPLFVGIAIILVIVGMFPSDSGWSSYEETGLSSDEDEPEEDEHDTPEDIPEQPEESSDVSDRTKQELLAEKILKRRYARGELTDEEYERKRARL